MKKNILIIVIVVAILAIGVGLTIGGKEGYGSKEKKLDIVVTTFSSYDFVKHITGDNANVTFLLGPGVDSHGYEPSASDLIKIQKADMFIYLGGEMEQWVEKVLNSDSINTEKIALIKITDSVEMMNEEVVDEMHEHEEHETHEEEGAFNQHIWTSPKNAIKMIEYLNTEICKLDFENKEVYQDNTEKYVKEIEVLQADIQNVVNNKVRDTLIFGDKMPMQYFLNEYDLKASAAFTGCSTETEPSAKTIAYLISKIKEEQIPVVLYIELSTGKTAKIIEEETGAKALQIQTLHNVSKDDFDNGETYVSLMRRNIDVVKQALQ